MLNTPYLRLLTISILLSTTALAQSSRRILMSGTSGMSYMTEWAGEFARENKIGVSVQFTSSRGAVQCLLNKTCDVGMATEEEPGLKNAQLSLTPFALGGAVIVVSKDVPLDSLTMDQAKKIFAGEIKNWSEVGGPSLAIKVWRRRDDSGLHKMFTRFIPVAAHLEVIQKMKLLDAKIKNEKGIIAYYNLAIANSKRELPYKILNLNGVAPSSESLRNGKYPLVHRYYLARRKDRENDELLSRLIQNLLAQREEKMEDLGVTPF